MKRNFSNIPVWIAIFFLITISCLWSKDLPFFVVWDYYPDKGSADAAFLSIYELFFNSSGDSVTSIKCWADTVNVQWDRHRFMIEDDGEVHYFIVTATDTAGNESIWSNFGILDLKRPFPVSGVRAELE